MAKKASKKVAKKPASALPDGWEAHFHAAVHPLLAGGFAEPAASQHARAAAREFARRIQE